MKIWNGIYQIFRFLQLYILYHQSNLIGGIEIFHWFHFYKNFSLKIYPLLFIHYSLFLKVFSFFLPQLLSLLENARKKGERVKELSAWLCFVAGKCETIHAMNRDDSMIVYLFGNASDVIRWFAFAVWGAFELLSPLENTKKKEERERLSERLNAVRNKMKSAENKIKRRERQRVRFRI